MNFFEHAIRGEETDKFPKWGGTEHISTVLDDTQTAISNAGSGGSGGSGGSTCTPNDPNTYFKESDMAFIKLDKSRYNKLSPEIIKEFDQSYTNDTRIHKIFQEYLIYIKGGEEQVEQLENNKEVIDNPTAIKETLSESKKSFADIGSLLESASDSVAKNFVDLQVKFSDYILLGFNVIFGVFLAISVITLACLSLYVWLKVFPLKYVIHVMWNLSMLLLFIGLIIGSVLGIVSSVSKQLSPVMGYLLSPEYISSENSVISAVGNTGDMLDTCLNGNGNLSTVMQVGDEGNQFDNYYESSAYLGEIYNKLNINEMEAIQEAINYITTIFGNVGSVLVDEDETLSEYLDDFNDDCDSSVQVSSVLSSSINCNSFSSTCQTKCQELNWLGQDINKIHSQLTGTGITASTEYFKEKFSKTLICLKERIEPSINTINAINEALDPILGGEGSFLSLFNCEFIKKDIIRFCDRFSNHFYHSTFNMFLCCTLIGLCSYIGIYFLLPAMYRFSQEARAPETELEAPAEQEPESEKKEVIPADGGDSASVKPMIYSQVDVDSKVI